MRRVTGVQTCALPIYEGDFIPLEIVPGAMILPPVAVSLPEDGKAGVFLIRAKR
jgi:hypothetical protein